MLKLHRLRFQTRPPIGRLCGPGTLPSRFLFSSAHKNSPISTEEFAGAFQSCNPWAAWPESLAIAFSGGPDSTCLLLLLKQLISGEINLHRFPKKLVAVTIDHRLQSTSTRMTEQCSALANSLQIRHIVLKIPWGNPPFPPIPLKEDAFENIAREARHHLLLEAMGREKLPAIAFGHHIDDQIETALLRISRGSSEIGAAGMRKSRRWGMGFRDGPGCLGWAGHLGMDKWIVRPLLDFPKDRLIATCQAVGLEYVLDPTNLKPEATPRNRIRYALESAYNCHGKRSASSPELDLETKTLLNMAETLPVASNNSRSQQICSEECTSPITVKLRSAIDLLSQHAVVQDNKGEPNVSLLTDEEALLTPEYVLVSTALKACIQPSPPSTLLLSSDALARVTDNSIRIGMVRHVLRYVSPFPWGSPKAEAGRRSASLQRIVNHIWPSESSLQQHQQRTPAKLVAGAGVMWTPAVITSSSTVKFRTSRRAGEKMGWLISRQPPILASDISQVAEEPAKSSPLIVNVTDAIIHAIRRDSSDNLELLYDCRFLLHINPHLLPSAFLRAGRRDGGATQFFVKPHTTYFLPRLVIQRMDPGSPVQEIEVASLLPSGAVYFPKSENNKSEDSWTPGTSDRVQEAVRIEWVRTLDVDVPYEYALEHSRRLRSDLSVF